MRRLKWLWLVGLLALEAALILLPGAAKFDILPAVALLPLGYVVVRAAGWPARRREAGALVAQTILSTRRVDYLFLGLRILVDATAVFVLTDHVYRSIALTGVFGLFSLESYLFAAQIFRPELRQNGVLLLSSLLPLRRVESWCWTGQEGETLVLRASAGQRSTDVHRSLRLLIDPQDRAAVETYLDQRRRPGPTPSQPEPRPVPASDGGGRPIPRFGVAVLFCLALATPFVLPRALNTSPPRPSRLPAPAATRDSRWRQDLAYLATNLPRLHKNFFFHLSRPSFQAAVAKLNRAIPSLSDDQIVLGLDRIVAMAGDTHTALDLGLGKQNSRFQTYPLALQWIDGGLYVIDTTPQYRRALGAQVVQIGSLDVQQANRAVSVLIPHENAEGVLRWSPFYLVTPEILQTLGILPSGQQARFVFQDSQGDRFAMDFAPVPRSRKLTWLNAIAENGATAPLYLTHQDQNYWYTYLSESKTLYFAYNRCAEQTGKPFATLIQQLLTFMKSHRIDRFVLDLRNNDGGEVNVAQPLIDALKQNQSINQPGHLYVLTGRQTLSAAIVNAEQLRRQTHAVVVGGPTAGKPNFYAGIATFRLPNSGLTVDYSTAYIHEVSGNPSTFEPDLTIRTTAADYFQGRDPVLATVLGTRP